MAEKNYKSPATVTIENKGTEVTSFRYFRVNFPETLQPNDKVVMTVADSSEIAYYKALENAGLGLVVTVVPAA